MAPSPPRLRILSGPYFPVARTLPLSFVIDQSSFDVMSSFTSSVRRSSPLKLSAVGGNSISAFLSWRLQATHACDVTLVWKSGFESVAQYGISFKYGQQRSYERCLADFEKVEKIW